MGIVVPGRCPGLSHYAPLGRKTGAALKAINGAIVTIRCAHRHQFPAQDPNSRASRFFIEFANRLCQIASPGSDAVRNSISNGINHFEKFSCIFECCALELNKIDTG